MNREKLLTGVSTVIILIVITTETHYSCLLPNEFIHTWLDGFYNICRHSIDVLIGHSVDCKCHLPCT